MSQAPSILVPTELEARHLGFDPASDDVTIIGFGVVEAGARTARHLAERRPPSCVLLGVGGSLHPDRAAVESLVAATAVELDGVGVGRGASFLSPAALGFGDEAPTTLDLTVSGAAGLIAAPVLTVTAGSADPDDAANVAARHPDCVVEDLETFAVARSCQAFGTRLCAVRAVSNVAGDRDKSRWRIAAALERLRAALPDILASL